MVSDEKSIVVLFAFLIQVRCVVSLLLLSRFFSRSLVFISLTVMYVCVVFFLGLFYFGFTQLLKSVGLCLLLHLEIYQPLFL